MRSGVEFVDVGEQECETGKSMCVVMVVTRADIWTGRNDCWKGTLQMLNAEFRIVCCRMSLIDYFLLAQSQRKPWG
jgi:hypothetical protein